MNRARAQHVGVQSFRIEQPTEYRLAQIEQITGLSLHKTDEQTMLYLGMLLHED